MSTYYRLIYRWVGSVSRSMYPPGPIARRIADDILLRGSKDYFVQQQLKSILKEDNLLKIVKTAPKNTVVILDYAYELWTYYYDQTEMFDICSFYGKIKNKMPEWFNNQLLKNIKHFDQGDVKIFRSQYDLNADFMVQLSKLKIPVIVFPNTFTSNIFIKETNSVGKIFPLFNKQMPFLKKEQLDSDMMAYQYTQKIIQTFYKGVDKEMPSSFRKFDVDLEQVYSDLDHPMGYHPAHWHYTCRKNLLPKLEELIKESLVKQNTTEPIILN